MNGNEASIARFRPLVKNEPFGRNRKLRCSYNGLVNRCQELGIGSARRPGTIRFRPEESLVQTEAPQPKFLFHQQFPRTLQPSRFVVSLLRISRELVSFFRTGVQHMRLARVVSDLRVDPEAPQSDGLMSEF